MDVNRVKLPGGYEFKKFKGQASNKLVDVEIPESLVVPLRQGFGEESRLLVEPGDKVKTGEILARSDDRLSSPIHSPADGSVKKIIGLESEDYVDVIRAVVIEVESVSEALGFENSGENWAELSAEDLQELLYLSGVSALAEGGIPTAFKSSLIKPEELEDVIICGPEPGVYEISPSILLADNRMDEFVEGLQIMQQAYPDVRFHLVLQKKEKELLDILSARLNLFERVSMYIIPARYPAGDEKFLIPALLNKRYPGGYQAINVGALKLDFQTVLHARNAVVKGEPVIDKIAILAGPGFYENVHLKVKVGTPIKKLISNFINKNKKSRLVKDNLLTGLAVEDNSHPVTRAFDSLIALNDENEKYLLPFAVPGFSRDSFSNSFLCLQGIAKKDASTLLHGEERPCIKCNYCQDVCPADIIPHYIYEHIAADVIDEKLVNIKIFDCIECNLCSYVCPSKISLGLTIQEGKTKLDEIGIEETEFTRRFCELKGIGSERDEESV